MQQKAPRPRVRVNRPTPHGYVHQFDTEDDTGTVTKERKSDTKFMFTDLHLRRLKPRATQYVVYDTVQTGLKLLISPGGTKTFLSQFRLGDKYPTRSIGRLQENSTDTGENFSVRAARERCRLDRAMGNEGKDPRTAINPRGDITVREGIDRYIEERCKVRQRSWDQTQANLMRACANWLDKPVVSITRDDCRAMVKERIKRGKHRTADQALTQVKGLWKWLAGQELIEVDTMHPVSVDIEKGVRTRTYSDDEMRAIWRASNKLKPDQAVYIKLLILLGPRMTSLALMRWHDLDLNVWTTPPDLVKQRKTAKPRTYKTPLPEFAQTVLGTLQRGKGKDRVFRSLPIHWSKSNRPTLINANMMRVLMRHGAPKDLKFHCFRHTLATWLEDQGHDIWDRALALNHSIGGVTAGYSHGHALERKREVLTKWSRHIEQLTMRRKS